MLCLSNVKKIIQNIGSFDTWIFPANDSKIAQREMLIVKKEKNNLRLELYIVQFFII